MFFLEQLEFPIQPMLGLVISDTKIWVPKWKRLVTAPNAKTPGEHASFQ